MRSAAGFGVYVHVPFCARRCGYCDFATWTDRTHLADAYVDACVQDLQRHVAGGMPAATTVFVGGGTPSLLAAEQLARILDAIPRAPGAEVTVECNPDSVDDEKLARCAAAGVTRVSLGVQSLAPHVLHALDRTHDPANVARAVRAARRAGIAHLNVDLIYGTPGESLADWRATVSAAIDFDPDHVSAYALTVEPGTPLGRSVAAGDAPAPDDDDQAEKYALADDLLVAAGFAWYEISNWARPGGECRHNLGYWRGGEYVGIGCAAHGHTGGRRWWNVRTPERYVALVAAGSSPVAGSESLDAATAAEESFALALRTGTGAPVHAAAREVAEDLAARGLLDARARHPDASTSFVLTRAGRLLAADVTARLLLAGAAAGPGAPPTPVAAPGPAGTR
jgi:oxygen-independent coproporphyrinogen-3 oxidase